MITDEQALIEMIRANPSDDTPRLVLADWFEENNQSERAEFIRIQCELARLPERKKIGYDMTGEVFLFPHGPNYWEFTQGHERLKVGDRVDIKCIKVDGSRKGVKHGLLVIKEPQGEFGYIVKKDEQSLPLSDKVNTLQQREQELLNANWQKWWGKFDQRTRPLMDWEIRRGFVRSVGIKFANWLMVCDMLLAIEPVQDVKLWTWPSETAFNFLYNPPSLDHIPLTKMIERREVIRRYTYPYPSSSLTETQALKNYFHECWPGIDFEVSARA